MHGRDPAAPAARSQGPSPAHFVRFTEKENSRLHEVKKREGVAVAKFLHQAAMKALEELESKWKAEDDERKTKQAERVARRIDPTAGIGIRDKLRREEEYAAQVAADRAQAAPPPVQQPQFVIAQATAPADADLDQLAHYVAKGGSGIEQGARLRVAADVVRASSTGEEQARRLKVLDDKVKKLGSSGISGFFDMLEGIIK